MLIVAWLIGESFATGMNQRTAGRQAPAHGRCHRRHAAGRGVRRHRLLLGAAPVQRRQPDQAAGLQADWIKVADVSVYFLLVMVLVGMIAFGFRRGGDISTPYVQSVRLIVKNSVLWVMFLASMAASVFFSFDSHFNAIFPAEQRKRAAEIRTTSQIGGVVVRHRRDHPEAADRGSRGAVQHRRLEGLRQAAGEPRPSPRRARRARSRSTSSSRWKSAAAPSTSSRSASPRRRAARPASPTRRSR